METIENHGSGTKWHWYNVMHDLKEQGGLAGVVIEPLSVSNHGCSGHLDGNSFCITWVYKKFLLVSMEEFSERLVDAFAKVVEYKPFCRYMQNGLITVEWDNVNPEGRLRELKQNPEISELTEM